MGEDLHFKRQGPCGDGLPDAPKADDSERLSGELRADVLLAIPAAFDQALVGGMQIARQRQHQGNRLLGGRDRVAARGVHHHDSKPRGRLFIDVVGADAGAGDRLQPPVSSQGLGGYFHTAAADCPVKLGERLPQVFARQPGADLELDVSSRFQQLEPVFRKRIQDNHARHSTFLQQRPRAATNRPF